MKALEERFLNLNSSDDAMETGHTTTSTSVSNPS